MTSFKKMWICFAFGAASLSVAAPVATAQDGGDVKVKFVWETEGFPSELKVHELKKGVNLKLWTTGATSDKDLPVGKEIPADKGLSVKRGANKKLVLTMKNTSKKDIYFFATPHTVAPAKHSLGFDFRCLCLNHAYFAPAGKTWYRVVTLELDKGFSGKSVEVVHSLIPVTKERAGQVKTPGAEIPPPKST